MKVQVEDTLPRIRADVGDKAVAALADAQVARNLCRRREDRCQHWPVFCRQVRHRGDVTPRNEQDVLRRLWVDILKRDDILVLMDNLTRYLTCCNLAEQAVLNAHTNTFPPRYSSNHEISRIVPYCATKGGRGCLRGRVAGVVGVVRSICCVMAIYRSLWVLWLLIGIAFPGRG